MTDCSFFINKTEKNDKTYMYMKPNFLAYMVAEIIRVQNNSESAKAKSSQDSMAAIYID